MDIILFEDELIIMIAKGNEEALRLLFSFYEKKMVYEAKQIALKKINFLDFDDYIQEIKINFLNVLGEYDYKKGKLYSFWIRLFKFHMIYLLNKFTNINELSFNDSMLDNEVCKKDDYYVERKDLSFDLNMNMDSLLKKDDLAYKVIVKWSEGFKYEEIGKMYNLNRSTVAFYINKAINYLKEKML